jgi:predicted Rossmann-fold nucleotide-binding protein
MVRFPVILVGVSFWSGLIDWIKDRLLSEENISEGDLELFSLVDSPEEAVTKIEEFYKKFNLKPNF